MGLLQSLRPLIQNWLSEDDLCRNISYDLALNNTLVKTHFLFKSSGVISGLPLAFEVFKTLGAEVDKDFEASIVKEFEGQRVTLKAGDRNLTIPGPDLPFSVALNGERLALNLFQRASSIASYTRTYVDALEGRCTKVLDTRKTTPGLRFLEKYATRSGGALNHRFGQTDAWMVKDNHKTFFGGTEKAIEFFQNLSGAYTPIIVEIHDLQELSKARSCGVRHFMLDNFSPEDVRTALESKKIHETYEVSGGITLETLKDYALEGVDFISVGKLTYGAPPVDISFKYSKA